MKIEKMSSKQAAKALSEAADRLDEVQGRIEQIKPPAKANPAKGPRHHTAPRPDPLATAGPEYRELVEAGEDPKALADLTREHEELVAERTMLQLRRDKLRDRRKEAEEEEARAEAPGKARDLLDALPDALDTADAALTAAADALDRVGEIRRELDAARDLLDNGEPYYSPEALRRLWALDAASISGHLLRRAVSTRPDALPAIVAATGGGRVVRPAYRNDCATKLAPPTEGFLERVGARFQRSMNPQHKNIEDRRDSEHARREWAEARARELAEPLDVAS